MYDADQEVIIFLDRPNFGPNISLTRPGLSGLPLARPNPKNLGNRKPLHITYLNSISYKFSNDTKNLNTNARIQATSFYEHYVFNMQGLFFNIFNIN